MTVRSLRVGPREGAACRPGRARRESASSLRYSSSARTAGMVRNKRFDFALDRQSRPRERRLLALASWMCRCRASMAAGGPPRWRRPASAIWASRLASQAWSARGSCSSRLRSRITFSKTATRERMVGVEGGHQPVEKPPAVAERGRRRAGPWPASATACAVCSPRAPELFCSCAVDQHQAARGRRHRPRRPPAPAGPELHIMPLGVATSAAMAQALPPLQRGKLLESVRRAGPGPATEAKWLPADWSCRRHWGRSGR